jgi:hypothetical protein
MHPVEAAFECIPSKRRGRRINGLAPCIMRRASTGGVPFIDGLALRR